MNSFMAIIVPLFLASILFVGHQQVQATRILSENEQIGSTLNIRTINEEVYDCVDFYKQPAFSNPLLHNLTFKIEEKQTRQAPLDIGLKGGGCPFGTVPIARSTKKAQTYRPLQNSNIIPFNETKITPQWDPLEAYRCYAIVRTADSGPVYMGASGDVSIYNPAIDGTQYSASRMRLQNGPDFIEAGWMVNQGLFKDTKTHLYIRFVAGGAKGGPNGCFNLDCPGFVLVAKDVPIGLVADKISERKKVQYVWRISIDKHKQDGNWWLSIGEQKHDIGYWPNNLFTSLSNDGATRVEWGGEVYLPPDAQGFAGMGCGNRADPEYDTRLTAYYGRTKLVKDSYNVVDPPDNTVKYQNCEKKYTVEDAGNTGNPQFGRLILFGGPHPF